MNKVWSMGLSSSFSFPKVFFLLMVLIVSSPSNNSPSDDSPSPREPKNQVKTWVLNCQRVARLGMRLAKEAGSER